MCNTCDKLLSLLLDSEVGKAEKEGTLKGQKETFGALCFATRQFNKARKIIEKQKD